MILGDCKPLAAASWCFSPMKTVSMDPIKSSGTMRRWLYRMNTFCRKLLECAGSIHFFRLWIYPSTLRENDGPFLVPNQNRSGLVRPADPSQSEFGSDPSKGFGSERVASG